MLAILANCAVLAVVGVAPAKGGGADGVVLVECSVECGWQAAEAGDAVGQLIRPEMPPVGARLQRQGQQHDSETDYECELAVVIGRVAKYASVEDAQRASLSTWPKRRSRPVNYFF